MSLIGVCEARPIWRGFRESRRPGNPRRFRKCKNGITRVPPSLGVTHTLAIELFWKIDNLRRFTVDFNPAFYLSIFQELRFNHGLFARAIIAVEDEFSVAAVGIAEWGEYVAPSWHNLMYVLCDEYLDAAFMAVPRSLPHSPIDSRVPPEQVPIWDKWQNNRESITSNDLSANLDKLQAGLLECKFPSAAEHQRIDAFLQQELFRACDRRIVTKRSHELDDTFDDFKTDGPAMQYAWPSIFLDDSDVQQRGTEAPDGPTRDNSFRWKGTWHKVPERRLGVA